MFVSCLKRGQFSLRAPVASGSARGPASAHGRTPQPVGLPPPHAWGRGSAGASCFTSAAKPARGGSWARGVPGRGCRWLAAALVAKPSPGSEAALTCFSPGPSRTTEKKVVKITSDISQMEVRSRSSGSPQTGFQPLLGTAGALAVFPPLKLLSFPWVLSASPCPAAPKTRKPPALARRFREGSEPARAHGSPWLHPL